MHDKRLSFIVAVCLAVAAAVGRPTLADRYVSTQGNDAGNSCTSTTPACRTIGAAIAAAFSGEVINIAAGTYKENLVISNVTEFSLTLQGGWDRSFTTLNVTANKTVLTGGKTDRALKISSD